MKNTGYTGKIRTRIFAGVLALAIPFVSLGAMDTSGAYAAEIGTERTGIEASAWIKEIEQQARMKADSKAGKEVKKATQAVINGLLEQFAKSNPQIAFLMAPLKFIIGEFFEGGNGPDPNKVIMEKINELNKKLDDMEYSLKQHAEDLACFTPIGGKFQAVTDTIGPLKDKIGDIRGKYEEGEIDEAGYYREIAALYYGGEYSALAQALSGATNAYMGDTSYSMDPKSIFRAAYDLQCNKVMFSGEAIDCMTPYIFRQLVIYLNGYDTLDTVLEGYEKVHGTNAAKTTRNTMYNNLENVMKLYVEFYEESYRCTFVNQSSDPAHHVKLNKKIMVVLGFSESFLGKTAVRCPSTLERYTPEVMKKYPLSKEQLNRLSDYAARKNKSIYDFLLDDAGFQLDIYPSMRAIGFFGLTADFTALDENAKISIPIIGTVTLREVLQKGNATYMPAGPQIFTMYEGQDFRHHDSTEAYNYMQAIQINRTGAKDTRLDLVDTFGTGVNANVLFFTY